MAFARPLEVSVLRGDESATLAVLLFLPWLFCGSLLVLCLGIPIVCI
jgi:hypothetical protein